MDDLELTVHVRDMMVERRIEEAWIRRALRSPDQILTGDDLNTHYLKSIEEFGSRSLRVIVNEQVEPKRIVTVFFDRRLGKSS